MAQNVPVAQRITLITLGYIHEPRQGYGYAYRRGIKEAIGDYIVLCEADGTFAASDLERFLVFAKDFPAVFGSRTNRSSLVDIKTMNPVRRIADVVPAQDFG